ncbi:MAG: hypothetical protein L0211_05160 [Planctomycetaceae bacterium]|nr:hypothetical protein [Planctomycetaceae bacterium]
MQPGPAIRAAPLRWRIPPEGDPRQLRLKLAQTGLAAFVCALILLVTAPPEVLGFGLVTLIPLTVGLAFWQWRRYRRSLDGPDNTWLDDAGLHWLDATGRQQSLPRTDVTAYRIAIEEDTLRPVPALTFELRGGQESQPLELHEPATPEEVRRWLADQWQVGERAAAGPAGGAAYDLAIDVYSECHDEFQEWHLEGNAAALGELFDVVAEVAQLPLSPPGVKPARRVILARRRETSRLAIEHDRHTHLGRDTICGTSEVLEQLAAHGRTALNEDLATPGDADSRRDLVLGKGNVWTFHLHVREVL